MEDFKTLEKDTSAKTFRIKSMRLLLTYKTHLNKENYIAHFEKKLKESLKIPNNEPVYEICRLGHENGDPSEPYEHTHVVMTLTKCIETTNARYFDYNEIHPNIKAISKKTEVPRVLKYIAKEDPANADLLVIKRTSKKSENNSEEEESTAEKIKGIWACDTLQEALLKYSMDLRDAMSIKMIYEHREQKIEMDDNDIPTLKWQTDLMDELKDRARTIKDKRKIIWYYDQKGATGKSQLARALFITEKKKWFIADDLGTASDAATNISHALDSGWTGHAMIVDLPRQAKNHNRVYTYLESIKNGKITSQKYVGKTRVFDIPHVVVFANWLPKVDKLSHDRWDIRELITTETEPEVIKLTVNEAREKSDEKSQLQKISKVLKHTQKELNEYKFYD